MNRTVSLLMIGVAAAFLMVGLIFLCAASASPNRLWIAIICLAIGGGLAAWSGISLRRSYTLQPENLAEQITALAQASGQGEVTYSQVIAALKVPDSAVRAALELIEGRGQCRRETRSDREVFIFPELQMTRVMRRCTHCGAEFPVKDALYECTRCGGKVELVKV